jgi:hypothetical protein
MKGCGHDENALPHPNVVSTSSDSYLNPVLNLSIVMDSLTPDQAQALWDAGGFLILSDLPEGSEFGIDGT